MSSRFEIPIRTVSPNRVRGLTRGAALGHAARKKKERSTARFCTMAWCGRHGPNPWLWAKAVTLTRVAPRAFDSDNLEASMKGIRDGIAEALGITDGPSGPVVWKYAQRRGGVREHMVEVEIA